MKLITAILICSSFSLLSQVLKYQLYLKDTCKGTIDKATFYSLQSGNEIFEITSLDNPFITIPKAGNYYLISNETDEKYPIQIDQNNSQDTLLIPSIYEFLPPPSSYSQARDIPEIGLTKLNKADSRSVFKRCNSLLQGSQNDYFNNGNIRFEGTFDSGYPSGELKEYHQNGIIKIVSVYDDEGYLLSRTRYDNLGKEIEK